MRQYFYSNARHSHGRAHCAYGGSAFALLFLILTLFALPTAAPAQHARLLVTVVDNKTGKPIKDLKASNFNILDDKTHLVVEHAEYTESLLDLIVLVDSSLFGEMVRNVASSFVKRINTGEQISIIQYDRSANLIQDFTSSKDLLLKALQQIDYGNNPRVLDALYASIDDGFEHTVGRRGIVLLSAGVEGRSRVSESEVLQIARQKNVAIYPVYAVGAERRMFRRLAEYSGGSYFEVRRLKLQPQPLADLVFSVVRGCYKLSVSGVYTLGRRIQVTIGGLPKSDKKIWASARPIG